MNSLTENLLITEGEAIWQSILAERLRRNSVNPVVVYCSQALNTSVKVNNTEGNVTDRSTSNSIPASSAAPSDKKLICTVVSTQHTKNKVVILKMLYICIHCQNTV